MGRNCLLKQCINSSLWLALRKVMVKLLGEVRWLPRKNSLLDFWSSNWLGESLIDSLKIPTSIGRHLLGKFSDYWDNGWVIPI